jgi:hypothetical protein
MKTTPLLTLLLATTCGSATLAQCTNPWFAENAAAGLGNEAWAVHRWDRDGAGPLPELWVFGGDFTTAGPIATNRVVTFDPTTGVWAALGGGVNGRVHAFATMPNGDLVAGGEFTTAAGIPTNRIARWNGASWAPMASGFDDTVVALTVRPTGALIAGGVFTVPGATARGIAEWTGSAWTAVGGSFSLGVARAFAHAPNGDLLVTGSGLQVTAAGSMRHALRWDGTNWSSLGTPGTVTSVFATGSDVLVRANGEVVLVHDAAGQLTGTTSRLAVWNGTAWSSLPMPANTTVARLSELGNGDLFASGSGSFPVSRWTGTNWMPLDDQLVDAARAAVALPAADELLAVGRIRSGPDIYGAARWDGTMWRPVGDGGWIGDTRRVTARLDGSIVASLTRSQISHLGLRSAGNWTPLGTARLVRALATLPNGDVVAGGYFTSIGGVSAARIARWNGTAWAPIGGGIGTLETDYVECLAIAPNGDLLAGGRFALAGSTAATSIARWNGTSWSALGAGFTKVDTVAVLTDGSVVVGGDLGNGTGPLAHVARWNGATWQALGGGLNSPVADLATRPDGGVAACGLFTLPGGPFPTIQPGVASWSPATNTWTPLGQINGGSISAVATATNGDLVIGGAFNNFAGLPLQGIARWNGTAWSALGAGHAYVEDFALAPNGDLLIGGGYSQPGVVYAPNVVRVSTTCPATVTTLGSGCSGAGGNPVLTATSLPWLRTTFRSRATGLPPNSLALEVLGLSSLAIPLPAILPQGLAGCTLTSAPDVLLAHVPSNGVLDLNLPLSDSIAFVGFQVWQQVVALSFGPSFDLVALTSSNSLALVEGWF